MIFKTVSTSCRGAERCGAQKETANVVVYVNMKANSEIATPPAGVRHDRKGLARPTKERLIKHQYTYITKLF